MTSTMSAEAVLAAGYELTVFEREQGRLYLTQSQNGIIGAIKRLSDRQWTYIPEPGSWSVALIVEHVLFVLERVAGPVREHFAQASGLPADRDSHLIDSIVINRFPNRLSKFSAPEVAWPLGCLRSPAEGVQNLTKAYAALTKFLNETPDLRARGLESPPLKAVTEGAYDLMDGYQWILAAAAHAERHTKQILEVAANDGFPIN